MEHIMDDKTVNGTEAVSYPELLNVSPSPHIKSPDSTSAIMLRVMIALIPAAVWGVYRFGLRAAVILILTTGSSVLFEFLYQKLMRKRVCIGDLSAAVTGLLIAMNLPSTAPLWLGVAGSFFAIIVVKALFGGLGRNIVNPALAARVFMFAWPGEMGTFARSGVRINDLAINLANTDAIAGATPLASIDSGISPDGVTIFDLVLGRVGGCIGEVSAVLLILGGIYLLCTKVITWHIPVSFIGTAAVMFALFPMGGADRMSYMLYSIFSGGLLLGAIFMATDYVTSPVSPAGQIVYGVGCGLITVFIRYFGGYPEGVSFAILIMNLLSHYIDKAFAPRRFGGKSNG